MNRTFALFGLLLALSVLMTACSSTTIDSSAEVKAGTGSTPAPTEAQEDQAVNSMVVNDETEVELGELI